MTLRAQVAVTALLAAMVAAGWMWLEDTGGPEGSAKALAERSGAPLVLVRPLALAEDKVIVRAVGTGDARRSASLYPNSEGEVVEVLFEAEQRVSKGTPLLRLEGEQERLAVRLAEVAETEARRQVERYERLAPKGTVSAVALQTAQADLASASLRLAQAKEALEDRTVYAPFEGIVGLSEIDPGDRVTDETMITTLDDRSVIEVKFSVPEEFAGRLKVGNPVAVRPWTVSDQILQGTISAIDSRIDPVTRSLRVKARIPNPEQIIRPGTSFDVQLEFTGGKYPSIPEVAVLWSGDGAYVWRIVGNKAEKVFVKMVRRERGQVLVQGTLAGGDLIVVEGVQGLREGQTVDAQPHGADRTVDPPTTNNSDPA